MGAVPESELPCSLLISATDCRVFTSLFPICVMG